MQKGPRSSERDPNLLATRRQDRKNSEDFDVHPHDRDHDAESAIPRELHGSTSFNALFDGIEVTDQGQGCKDNGDERDNHAQRKCP